MNWGRFKMTKYKFEIDIWDYINTEALMDMLSDEVGQKFDDWGNVEFKSKDINEDGFLTFDVEY